jgi:hypothetical protein
VQRHLAKIGFSLMLAASVGSGMALADGEQSAPTNSSQDSQQSAVQITSTNDEVVTVEVKTDTSSSESTSGTAVAAPAPETSPASTCR